MKTCSHFNVLRFVGTSSWVNIICDIIYRKGRLQKRNKYLSSSTRVCYINYSNCNFILETSFCTRVRQRSVKNSKFAFCWNAPHDFLKASVTSYLFTGWIKLNDFLCWWPINGSIFIWTRIFLPHTHFTISNFLSSNLPMHQ